MSRNDSLGALAAEGSNPFMETVMSKEAVTVLTQAQDMAVS
jgi:hypothetical protein